MEESARTDGETDRGAERTRAVTKSHEGDDASGKGGREGAGGSN